MKYWSLVVCTILAGAGIVWHQSLLGPPLLSDLHGAWAFCHLPADGDDSTNCATMPIILPQDLPRSHGGRFSHWLLYETTVSTPPVCRHESCALVIGEVGDAVEISLNGRVVDKLGDFPPRAKYEKNYPVASVIPSDLWRASEANCLRLKVYSFKFSQSGPRRSPLGIALATDARAFARAKIFRNVFAPLASALVLTLVLAITMLFPLASIRQTRLLPAYQMFCGVSALFLVSFSEVPRQFLPVPVAIPLHFLLRYGSDWVFFCLLCQFFCFQGRWVRALHAVYAAGVGVHACLVLCAVAECLNIPNLGFDRITAITYGCVDHFFALLVLGPLVGAYGSYQMRRSAWSKVLIAAFVTLACFQAYDYMVYAGSWHGDYISKFHHLIIGFLFSGLLIRRAAAIQTANTLAARAEMTAEAEVRAGRLALQVAHDIRSPLAALTMLKDEVGPLPEDVRLIFREAITRIGDICNLLSLRHGSNAARLPQGDDPVVSIPDALEAIVGERRVQYRARPQCDIELQLGRDCFAAFVKTDETEFKRVLTNLVNNAVESLEGAGKVTVSVSTSGERVIVVIEDGGKGMDAEMLRLVGTRGLSFDKLGGSGLGLHHAYDRVAQWGGELTLESRVGVGTRVTLTLPLAPPPRWLAHHLSVPADATVVILDDDASIHHVWRRRFAALDAGGRRPTVRHFSRPGDLTQFVQRGTPAALYLLDHELLGCKATGRDLARTLGIARRAVLVTSHAGEPDLQKACLDGDLRLIPKAMALYVPICVTPATPSLPL